jgi:hypothetical protein
MTPVLGSITREPKMRLMVDVIETAMPSLSMTDVWVWVFIVNRLVGHGLSRTHRSVVFRSIVHRMVIFRRMSRVVSQVSSNNVGIVLRGYLVDLRRVVQEHWVAYFGSASGQQSSQAEQAIMRTARRSQLDGQSIKRQNEYDEN